MTGTRFLAVVTFALILSSCSAFGDSITTFNFSQHGNGALSHGDTFKASAYSVTIWAFSAMCRGNFLFYKNGSGNENGLGLLQGESDHEISGLGFVQFSTSGIIGNHLKDFLSVGSLQPGESWKIFGSNMLGIPGVLLLSGTSQGEINITQFANHYKYISLGAGSGDVLLSDLQVSAVPEPGTLTLMGLGFICLGGVCIGRLKARRARSLPLSS